MVSSAKRLCVLSSIPGRIRLHLLGWKGDNTEWIENRFLRIDGVESVRANPLTGNILVHFDQRTMDRDALPAKLNDILNELPNDNQRATVSWSGRYQPTNASRSLLRVGVCGLLGHAVVDSLWFGAGFLGSAMGLPLAGLGPLHVLMDIAVWTMALFGEKDHVSAPKQTQPAGQSHRPAGQHLCPA